MLLWQLSRSCEILLGIPIARRWYGIICLTPPHNTAKLRNIWNENYLPRDRQSNRPSVHKKLYLQFHKSPLVININPPPNGWPAHGLAHSFRALSPGSYKLLPPLIAGREGLTLWEKLEE
ncbi:hypothetical protein CEXT_229181 [Caerostris extrusa]|uniref:Uncharacterized protein n=1 Tax=Caerostris extrusa TaxID=172846 RepID=A0AAV4WQQ8_CAEEX|nr:hypothetical protein CEXT_229181 [Caerostris extrusa]